MRAVGHLTVTRCWSLKEKINVTEICRKGDLVRAQLDLSTRLRALVANERPRWPGAARWPGRPAGRRAGTACRLGVGARRGPQGGDEALR